MKSYFLKPAAGIFVILVLILSFSGFNLFDKADDITFDLELDHTFAVDENLDSDGESVSYAHTEAWDPTDNADLAKYKDKIKEIKSIKLLIQ